MSTNNYLVCTKCNRAHWIGQGDHIYIGEPETLEALSYFLNYEHKEHPLLYTDEHNDPVMDKATYDRDKDILARKAHREESDR